MQTSPSFDVRSLRNALGAFATGVTIVTTRGPAGDIGLTANSFSSVSLNPPMVLWSLAKTSASIDAFRDAPHFAIHILSSEQEHLSTRFASKTPDRFAGLDLERGPDDIPMLANCSARFTCRTAFQYEGGDHVIFVGEVVEFTHSRSGPLVFHGGRYGMLFQKDATQQPHVETENRPSPNDLTFLLSQAYFRIRQDVVQEPGRHDWTELEYAVLRTLGREDGLLLSQLQALNNGYGEMVTPKAIEELVARGLVRVAGPVGPDSEVWMTETSRQTILEIMAVLSSSEAKVLEGLDTSEIQVLKQLLHRIGSATVTTG